MPKLEWYKDAVPLSKLNNPRYKVISSMGLQVRKVQPSDTGIFQCFARNSAGEAQVHTYLDVTSKSDPRPGRGRHAFFITHFPDSRLVIIDTQTIEMVPRVLDVTSCKVHLLSAVAQQFPGVTDVLFLIYGHAILTPFCKRCSSSLWRGLSGVDYIVVFVRALP